MPKLIKIRQPSFDPNRGVCAQDFETTIQPYLSAEHLRGLLNFSALWNQVTYIYDTAIGDNPNLLTSYWAQPNMARSRFGVVIVSESFLEKRWPKQELNGLMALEENGQKVILPVWHNVTKSRVAQSSPILADRIGAETKKGIQAVAAEIIDIVLYRASNSPSTLFPSLTRRLVQSIGHGSPSPAVIDFLRQHERILTSALHATEIVHGDIESSPSNDELLKLYVGTPVYTIMSLPICCLAFGNSSGPLFQNGGQPVLWLERMVRQLKEPDERLSLFNFMKERGWEVNLGQDFILAGRRHELSESERLMLREFNESLGSDLTIRSYDWIIEACVRMDQRCYRTYA
jgi:hypothetical protein